MSGRTVIISKHNIQCLLILKALRHYLFLFSTQHIFILCHDVMTKTLECKYDVLNLYVTLNICLGEAGLLHFYRSALNGVELNIQLFGYKS